VAANSTIRCWGFGYYGQLGTGFLGYLTSPVKVVTLGP